MTARRQLRGPWQVHWSPLFIAAVCVAAAGCGPSSTVVTGTARLDGRPLDQATVQFFPVDGDGQTHHAFTDARGVYRAKISPVPMMVVISKPKVVGQSQMFPDSPPVDTMVESLPTRYSDRLKTELRVTPVEGQAVAADFVLISDAK
jgi:hypothetical protein